MRATGTMYEGEFDRFLFVTSLAYPNHTHRTHYFAVPRNGQMPLRPTKVAQPKLTEPRFRIDAFRAPHPVALCAESQ